MLKFFVYAGVVACVAAQQGESLEKGERELVNSISDNAKDMAARNDEIAQADATMQTLYETLSNADLKSVDEMSSDAAAIVGQFHGAQATVHQAMEREAAAQEAAFAAAEIELEKLMAQLETEKELAIHAAYVKAETETSSAAATLDATNAELAEATTSIKARIAQHDACSKKGAVWNGGACRDVSIPPPTQSVTHRIFTSNDGRDSGYVSNRYLKFVKKEDNTYIRVFYHDNFRVHGHTAHAQWDVMFCDANGNGCAECRTPGKIQHWRYSNHQGNWWMNDHWSSGTYGLCKRSDNRDMKKGTYQIKVRIDSNRYDIYTGHNQHNSIMVDEVFTA